MGDVVLLAPGWLALAPVLLAILWLRWRASRGVADWTRICEPRLLRALRGGAAPARRVPWPPVALAILVPLALADPARMAPGEPVGRSVQARVVALDLSVSMLASDVSPSRLEHARALVAELLAGAREGRHALVAFAGVAAPLTPLTSDARALLAVLPLLDPTVLAYQGSRPDLALEVAADLLERGGAAGGEVVLLTDGGHGRRALAMARRLRRAGHRLSVVAVGTASGGRVLVPGGGELTSLSGAPVRAPVDGAGLRALAAAGGGGFAWVDGASDPTAVHAALEGAARAVRVSASERSGWLHLGPWIALLSLAPALAAMCRPALLGCCIALALASGERAEAFEWHELWSRPDQLAARALARGETARLRTEDWRWRGAALHRAGRYEEAANAFAWGSDAAAHYNRGTALARAGRLAEALEALDRALALEPAHADARHNRALVAAALTRARGRAAPGTGRRARPGRPAAGSEPARAPGQQTDSGRGGPQPGAGDGPGGDAVAYWYGEPAFGPHGGGRPALSESAGERELAELEAVLLRIRDDPAELWRIKLSRGHGTPLPPRSDAW